jgi:hypothetical protein
LHLDVCNVPTVLADNKQVVNPKGDVEVAFEVDIEVRVSSGPGKANFDEEGMGLEVPTAGSLLEAVDRS